MQMDIATIYKKLALSSPHVEVMLRMLYWKNIKTLGRFRPDDNALIHNDKKQLDFQKIKSWLRSQGVKEGCLLVVHSSFDSLSGCELKPNEIIRELRNLIGEDGTLAMPVIRRFKEYPKPADWLTADFSGIECVYDPRKTPVSSGLLPSMLMREKEAVVSLHPLNTMAAVGALAQSMMEHNIDGEKPSPHGANSSWKFCLDHDAIIVALGVPMIHHLTIAHVKDEAFGKTPFDNWYNDIKFDIVMPDKTVVRKVVRERKPKWGLMHDAEMNFGNDLINAGVMHLNTIDGVQVGCLRAKELISFMQNHKNKAYPYYKLF